MLPSIEPPQSHHMSLFGAGLGGAGDEKLQISRVSSVGSGTVDTRRLISSQSDPCCPRARRFWDPNDCNHGSCHRGTRRVCPRLEPRSHSTLHRGLASPQKTRPAQIPQILASCRRAQLLCSPCVREFGTLRAQKKPGSFLLRLPNCEISYGLPVIRLTERCLQ